MSFGLNPLTVQGNLNRVRTHIVVPTFPQLSVSASYMGKAMAIFSLEGPFVEQTETATGIVNSPKPFVMGQIVISLLRSQALAGNWVAQAQLDAKIGQVTAYGDSSLFPTLILTDCSIIDIDPGAFDGVDPVTKVTVKGTFPINADLWAQV